MKCPVCNGDGGFHDYPAGEGTHVFEPCIYCKETGKVSFVKRVNYWLWQSVLPDWYFELLAKWRNR